MYTVVIHPELTCSGIGHASLIFKPPQQLPHGGVNKFEIGVIYIHALRVGYVITVRIAYFKLC